MWKNQHQPGNMAVLISAPRTGLRTLEDVIDGVPSASSPDCQLRAPKPLHRWGGSATSVAEGRRRARMSAIAERERGRTMAGIGHALAGFSVFSLQDASVKWLAGSLPIWEILFFRSVMILVLVTLITGPRNIVSVATGANRKPLMIRSGLILIAWLAFFTASRSLHLAELVTIYFATPIFVVILSILALKETVGLARWLATLVGFAGVLVASGPSGTADWFPVALTLFAAGCWAWTNILIRRMSQSASTLDLMIASSALFTVVCGAALPFIWVTPDLFSL
eukprot:gene32403-37319_t